MQQNLDRHPRAPGFSRATLVFLVFLAIALFFLLSEHRIHALGWLPLLLLAVCPLLHMFNHGGHGGTAGMARKIGIAHGPRQAVPCGFGLDGSEAPDDARTLIGTIRTPRPDDDR